MNISIMFLRYIFMILCILFSTIFMHAFAQQNAFFNTLLGLGIGIALGWVFIGFDIFFKKFNLRTLNTIILGLFIGYLMGQGIMLVFEAVLDISTLTSSLPIPVLEFIKICIFLFSIYIGSLVTFRSSDEIYISIPFVRLSQETQKKKDLLADPSLFTDPRIIDLASTGLLNHQLIIPRFIMKDFYAQSETAEENLRKKAKRSLEVMKKLEEIHHLNLRYSETDFPDISDINGKILKLARLLDTNILSGDISRLDVPNLENVTVINIHALANALKPLMKGGEIVHIKIQRLGKEPRQGVGYLEDGTMVVVNGGGEHIGLTIEAQVLSVKHTSSGRIVFCNMMDSNEAGTEAHHEL